MPDNYKGEWTMLIRTIGSAKSMAPLIRRIVSELDPGLPIANMRTLSEQLDISLMQVRGGAILFGIARSGWRWDWPRWVVWCCELCSRPTHKGDRHPHCHRRTTHSGVSSFDIRGRAVDGSRSVDRICVGAGNCAYRSERFKQHRYFGSHGMSGRLPASGNRSAGRVLRSDKKSSQSGSDVCAQM